MTALSPDTDIFDVLCFGSQKDAGTNLRVSGVPVGNFQALELKRPKLADTLLRNAIMTGIADAADVIHCRSN